MMALLCLAAFSQTALAETRTLKLYYVHTKERADVTYKRNGKYLSEGLKKANYMLRDWRRNETTKMDPKTLDILWQVYKSSGSRDYIHVVSGYRSPATNTMLRRTRGGQAEKSQHLLGKAVDFYLPDVKLSKLRAIAFKIQGGGVGYYPRSGSPFVHLDSGNVRAWPRMSRGELLALFPDGKTVHLPADGKPLPGYQAALAAYKNGKGASNAIIVDDSSSGSKKPTLWATLFGGGADETDDEAEVLVAAAEPAAKKPVVVAAAKPVAPPPVDIAALQPNALDGGPDASGSGITAVVQPDQQTIPAVETTAETPEFTPLPNRDAPVPSAAPRIVEAPQDTVLVAAVTPLDPAAVAAADALANAEIAAIDTIANTNGSLTLPSDGPVPTPRPVVALAALDPEISVDPADEIAAEDSTAEDSTAENSEAVDIASLIAEPQAEPQRDELRAAFAPLPQAAPVRAGALSIEPLNRAQVTPSRAVPPPVDAEAVVNPSADEGVIELAALPDAGPIPQLRTDELSASPQTTAQPVKPSPKIATIGAGLKTGVKTTGKSAKLLTARIIKKPNVKPAALLPVPDTVLSVNPDRFGPAGQKNTSIEPLKSNKNGKGPRVLPDGSTLVSSGKIAP